MARDYQDTLYRGRRRVSGNFGKLWLNNVLIFEISAFEAKVTADRDDVIIGADKDSKIVSLTGEGSFTIKQVFTRGFHELLRNWKNGWDTRLVLIGELADPDTPDSQRERIRFENVWLNELQLQSWTKGEVVEKEITFGFTPSDVEYESAIELANENFIIPNDNSD